MFSFDQPVLQTKFQNCLVDQPYASWWCQQLFTEVYVLMNWPVPPCFSHPASLKDNTIHLQLSFQKHGSLFTCASLQADCFHCQFQISQSSLASVCGFSTVIRQKVDWWCANNWRLHPKPFCSISGVRPLFSRCTIYGYQFLNASQCLNGPYFPSKKCRPRHPWSLHLDFVLCRQWWKTLFRSLHPLFWQLSRIWTRSNSSKKMKVYFQNKQIFA